MNPILGFQGMNSRRNPGIHESLRSPEGPGIPDSNPPGNDSESWDDMNTGTHHWLGGEFGITVPEPNGSQTGKSE